MVRVFSIAAALACAFLVLAPTASAHGRADFRVDIASALPGASVTVHGVFIPPDFSAVTRPVTVTLGEDGPVLGQAAVDADGSWTLTFTLPTATALGAYALNAFVLDAQGQLIDGLLARAELVVGTPAPDPSPAEATPPLRPVVPAPTATVTAPVGSGVQAHAAGVAQARPKHATRPTARALPRHATGPIAVHTSRTSRPASVPRTSSAPRAQPPPLRPGPRAEPFRPVTGRTSAPDAAKRAFPWILLTVLLALGTAAATGFALLRRSPRPRSPMPLEAELEALLGEGRPPAIDPIEAELQELLRRERERVLR